MVTTRTLRRPLAAATGLLVLGVCALAWYADVRVAAYALAGGLAVAAVVRLTLPDRAVLTARGRRFDVVVLLVLAVALALLAPWGLTVSLT